MTTEIFRCVAGSRLFGTATKDSDTDYKAVHLPSREAILLGTADAVIDRSTGPKKSANSKDDVDYVSHPLHGYLRLLSKMETNALETLFAENEGTSDTWIMDTVYDNRFKVMTSNMKSFTGFAKQQAMRYAVRGDRLDTLERVVDTLVSCRFKTKQSTVRDAMPLLQAIPNVSFVDKLQPSGDMLPYLNVFGREVPVTAHISEAIKVYEKPIREAGKRAREATGGPDWKGLYHAQRVVDEGLQLFATGELVFPCENAPAYLAIRSGQMELEAVLGNFEDALAKLEELKPIPEFRATTDQEWIDQFVLDIYGDVVTRRIAA